MKVRMKFFFVVIFSVIVHSAFSQAPFSRGVNLTGWFQGNSAGQIQFTKFTKKDLVNIKSLGCDVIRLPVRLHSMTSGSPSFILDPVYLTFQDSVVKWCEQLHIYLIIDNHTFDSKVNTSEDIGDALIKVWSQMASRYKDKSDYILYEILNEPHGITTALWGNIQKQVIAAIREKDTKHTIVIGASGYNSYNELKNLPVYDDPNLLYTFHFYDPFIFTHQGADWSSPSMAALSGVPFPYNAANIPVCPPILSGTSVESRINNYSTDGTVAKVKQLIDIAINFRTARNVKIFCGEFGVYIPNSPDADRSYWYGIVKQYFEDNNIPWTIWDYKGGFGLFKKGSDELFDHDLNVPLLQSLGLNVPVQTPLLTKPDSAGFPMYTDFMGEHIFDGSYGAGIINYYSSDLPNNNKYDLKFSDFSRYNAVLFNFSPDKDLSKLVSEGYAIDFMIRGNSPGIKFEMRFTDSKTLTVGDHPWRIGYTIDDSNVTWDMKWHHLYIPLSSFNERGSWDNGTWFNAQNKFDWSAVDKFEISTEFPVTTGKALWFDNIHITNRDSAIVREFGVMGIEENSLQILTKIKISPNPMENSAVISYTLETESRIDVGIFSLTGIKVRSLSSGSQLPGYQSIVWNGYDDSGVWAQPGLYICVVRAPGYMMSGKILKIK